MGKILRSMPAARIASLKVWNKVAIEVGSKSMAWTGTPCESSLRLLSCQMWCRRLTTGTWLTGMSAMPTLSVKLFLLQVLLSGCCSSHCLGDPMVGSRYWWLGFHPAGMGGEYPEVLSMGGAGF